MWTRRVTCHGQGRSCFCPLPINASWSTFLRELYNKTFLIKKTNVDKQFKIFRSCDPNRTDLEAALTCKPPLCAFYHFTINERPFCKCLQMITSAYPIPSSHQPRSGTSPKVTSITVVVLLKWTVSSC